MKNIDIKRYMPLSEATYFILVSLIKPNHGYGIMQFVEEITNGRVKIGPGTLYGALNKLLNEDLISRYNEDNSDRKKTYIITERGKQLIELEFLRIKDMVECTKLLVAGEGLVKNLSLDIISEF